jgi:hypothetical protein
MINELPENVRPSRKLILENGFFAVMGGYRIRTMKDWPGGCTLTPQDIVLLATLKSLPDVDTESIMDRSKADDLVKGLACSQTLWIIIQVIARKASDLPVTLLELNTVAHVVCAILMYVLWWCKPQGINQPEFVSVHTRLQAPLSSTWPHEGQLGIPRTTDSQADTTGNRIGNNKSSGCAQEPTDQMLNDHSEVLLQEIPENKSGIKVAVMKTSNEKLVYSRELRTL